MNGAIPFDQHLIPGSSIYFSHLKGFACVRGPDTWTGTATLAHAALAHVLIPITSNSGSLSILWGMGGSRLDDDIATTRAVVNNG